MVVLAGQDLLEAADGVLEGHQLAGQAGELLRHEEGLREEALDLARAVHRHAVVLAELVHAEDGDDVLEVLVLLQGLLNAASHRVVTLTQDGRVQHGGGGVEGVHGGVDADGRDLAREHRRGVQVSEGGGRRRVREVVGGDVHGLHGRDGALGGRRDALLHGAHLRGQRGLITHGRRDTTEEGRHLGARLREAEDVIHEQEHVLPFLVAEVLGHGQGREGHAGARAGRLVHLAVDQRRLREHGLAGVQQRLLHLEQEVVALTRTLTDAREAGHAAVALGHVVDELHDEHGLAHAGAAEEADLAAALVGSEEVDDLDAGLEDLDLRALLHESRGLAVDGGALLRVDGPELVHGLADHVEDAPEALLADGNGDGAARVADVHAAHEAVRGVHRDGANRALAEVLGDLEGQVPVLVRDGRVGHLNRGEDLRERPRGELDVDDGTDDLRDASVLKVCRGIYLVRPIRGGGLRPPCGPTRGRGLVQLRRTEGRDAEAGPWALRERAASSTRALGGQRREVRAGGAGSCPQEVTFFRSSLVAAASDGLGSLVQTVQTGA